MSFSEKFSDNPYQAPQTSAEIYQAEFADDRQLWRKGNLLVMHKSAELPDRCVKSNVPTRRRLKRSLSWHPSYVYVVLLVNLLFYVLVALIVRKTATIHIGLSDVWFGKRRRAMLIGWSVIIISIAMVIVGIGMIDRNGAFGVLIVAGLLLFLFGAIFGLVKARMVAPTRISDTHIWLKGVCPEFLQDLPEWPHSP